MSSHQRIRVGIIGLGFGQNVHAPVFQSHPDCEVVAISGTRADKAREVAARLKIPRSFGDWREMLATGEIDLVAIATPPGVQYEAGKEALQRGLAVLFEKPLALTVPQAQELVALAKSKSLPVMVDFEFPEIPAWRQCRALLAGGRIGSIERVDVVWTTQTYANRERLSSWKTSTAAGGGGLSAFASHVFYNLDWFLADSEGRCVALRTILGRGKGDAREDTDTWVHLEVRYQSGCIATLRLDTDQPLGIEHSWNFKGASGNLKLSNLTRDYIDGFQIECEERLGGGKHTVEISEIWGAGVPENVSDGRIRAVARLANRLVNWRKSGVASQPDIQAGSAVQTFIDAALDSHHRGGSWVSIPPLRSE